LLIGTGACPSENEDADGAPDGPHTDGPDSHGPDTGGSDTEAALTCDPRPAYPALYSSCSGVEICERSDYVCAYQQSMDPAVDPAYCTSYCTFDVECPPVGTCSAVPLCLTPLGGGTGVCALDCADDKQCPEGMECIEDEDSGGLRYLCF
jgi:hypothetical protein